jgi:hypothetical protein
LHLVTAEFKDLDEVDRVGAVIQQPALPDPEVPASADLAWLEVEPCPVLLTPALDVGLAAEAFT